MRHSFAMAEGDGKLARRAFIAGAIMLPIAIKVGFAFAEEAAGSDSAAQGAGAIGKVSITEFSESGAPTGLASLGQVVKSEAEWKAQLANAPGTNPPSMHTAFTVARQEDTEFPGTGPNAENFASGLYRCICCDNALYTNETKFDSGTGWPSFWKPIAAENVVQNIPQQGGFKVSCALCDAHLGHVFDDGPQPTGLRYCMDGVALRFIPRPTA